MRYIKYFLLLGLVSSVMFSSCTEEPVASEVSRFTEYTFGDIPDRIEVPETDSTHTLTFTFDDNQITDVSVDLFVADGGDATDGADFSLNTAHVDLVALEKEGSFSFSIAKDYLTEGDESFFIELLSAEGHGQPLRQVVEVVIVDEIHDDELLMIFDWGVPFVFDGVNYNACQFVDMDVYLLDAAADMGGADLGIYQAATGACPEQIIVTEDTFADGEYWMGSNLWDNQTLKPLLDSVEYTLTVTVIKQTVFEATWVPAQNWISVDDDQDTDGNTTNYPVGRFTVNGSTFQVFSDDGTLQGEG